jgi:biotin transport system ATP-binding protein
VISISGVTVIKNNNVILDNVSATFDENRVGIIGSNGSGKSTFAKLLNGLEKASSGTIQIGHKLTNGQTHQPIVGFVFQNPDNQIVFPLVGEDLEFGLKKSGLSKVEIKDRIGFYLDKFNVSDLIERRTHELSGGEKQLIALIGVLVMEPEYIVLDEPTTLLDLRNRSILMDFMEKLSQKLIIVSHDLDLMSDMDRLIWIDKGQVKGDGEAASILAAYKHASKVDRC